MKTLSLVILLAIGLTACSSNPKSAEQAAEGAKAKVENAKAAVESKTKAVKEKGPGQILCEAQSDKRYVEVKTKGSGCELIYTKFDKEEVIATSAAGSAHCEKISERIQNNLKEAGFKCGQ